MMQIKQRKIGKLTFKLRLDFGAIVFGTADGLIKLSATFSEILLGIRFSELLEASVLVPQVVKSCRELKLTDNGE